MIQRAIFPIMKSGKDYVSNIPLVPFLDSFYASFCFDEF
jgi:hypothetical protein